MARCEWAVIEDLANSVLFQCNAAGCGRQIRFVKAGAGFPNPVAVGESWTPPENVLDWLDACPAPPE